MRRLVALLAILGVLLVAPPPVAASAEPTAVGEQALALIDYPWRSLGWDVRFLPSRDGLLGLTKVHEEIVEIYVRPGQSPASVASVVAHELGHVVDLTYLGEHSRARWLERRGLPPDTPWWPCAGCTDFDTGAGDFAEVFAHWLVPGHWRGELAPPPSPDELELLLPLLTLRPPANAV